MIQPARETGAGAILQSGTCLRGGRPIFSPHGVDKVLPAPAFRVQTFPAEGFVAGVAVSAAAVAAEGFAAAVAADAPISH